MTNTDQTTKPQAKRIKYSPPQLLKLDAPEGKALCSTGSGDGGVCDTGFSAGGCSTGVTAGGGRCTSGTGA